MNHVRDESSNGNSSPRKPCNVFSRCCRERSTASSCSQSVRWFIMNSNGLASRTNLWCFHLHKLFSLHSVRHPEVDRVRRREARTVRHPGVFETHYPMDHSKLQTLHGYEARELRLAIGMRATSLLLTVYHCPWWGYKAGREHAWTDMTSSKRAKRVNYQCRGNINCPSILIDYRVQYIVTTRKARSLSAFMPSRPSSDSDAAQV